MSLLRGFGVFLGWLSGSIVGVTALFYAVGFLASITALSYFGLNIFLLGYDTLVYLARGANAIMFFALELGRILIILSPVLAVYPLLRKGAKALGERLRGPVQKIPFYEFLKRSWRGALYGVLFIYMYFMLDRYIPLFNQFLGVEGVLLRPSPLAESSNDSLMRGLLCGRETQLRSNFLILAIVTLIASLVTLWAHRLTRNMPYRQIMMLPFVAILITFVFILPGVYGVTFLGQKLAPVVVPGEKGSDGKGHYLIGRGSEHLVLWDAGALEFRFLRSSEVKKMTIKPPVGIHQIHPGLRTACSGSQGNSKSGGKKPKE